MKKENQFPIVPIEKMTLIDSQFEDNNGNVWSALKLIEWSKKYKAFDLPLAGIPIHWTPFKVDTLDDFLFQIQRIKDTDLKHPIILSDKGQIADGWHRVAKAMLEGKTTIKAIRFEEMPPKDAISITKQST